MASRNKKRPVGISKTGNYTEKLFHRITKFSKTDHRKDGDFVYRKIPIEVKKVSAHKGKKSGTINQIRPLKNSVLVVRISNRRSWLVVTPRDVMKIVSSTRTRGQHCESPLECCNLSVKALLDYGIEEVTNQELKQKVSWAVRRTNIDSEFNGLAERFLTDYQKLARRHLVQLRKLLGD